MDMALPLTATPDHAVADVDEWTEVEFRLNLCKVFKRLMDFRELHPDELADRMNIGRSTLYGKLKSGKFTAEEVRTAARELRVRVEAFYMPVESLLSDTIIRWTMHSPQMTSQNTAVEDPFQLPLDFDSLERRLRLASVAP